MRVKKQAPVASTHKNAPLAHDSQAALSVADIKPARKPRSDIKGTGQDWRKGVPKVSAEQINRVSEEYFKYCIEVDRKPTFEGLALRLDVCSDTLKNYLDADDEDSKTIHNTDVFLAIKKAVDYLSDDIQQRNDAMSIFRAKQRHYGGYVDRQDGFTGGSVAIQINIGKNDEKAAVKYFE